MPFSHTSLATQYTAYSTRYPLYLLTEEIQADEG